MSLNRQPGPMNENALQMLRDKELKKGADVVTADGEQLGKALSIHHRPEDEVDPELKLYGSYLQVPNLMVGSHFYIPVDFIVDYDEEAQRVDLSVPISDVMNETWDREPSFIAGDLGEIEPLV
jgi:hypothetical protein